MHNSRLKIQKGHLFVEIDGDDWLLDTGAPTSFGTNQIRIEGRDFPVPSNYMGLTASQLTGFVGHPTVGIIGADILNEFDILIDMKSERVSFSSEQITLDGEVLEIDEFMGIPIIMARISGAERRMFFDTGAQISYFQDDSLDTFHAIGMATDFFPGIGQFRTETYRVSTTLGNRQYDLCCGSLPHLLGMTLMLAETEGIIGNEILYGRLTGYFPRRRELVLAHLSINSEIIAEDFKLQALKDYCHSENRICPQDRPMSELSQILLNNGVKTEGETIYPLPFYIPHWLGTIYMYRVLIFQDYIDCAYKNGFIDEVDAFIRNIAEHEWCHHGESA